jgi:hypothetical protein
MKSNMPVINPAIYFVIPAVAKLQRHPGKVPILLDSRLRRNDAKGGFKTFCETIIILQ